MPETPPPPALEELLEQFAWVRNLARTMVREADAEDLAQETMLRAIQSPPRHGQNIRAWLAQISRNISNSNRRRDKRRVAKMAEKAPKPREVPRPDEVFIKQEAGRILREEVESLNANERYLILVRYQEGLSVREIAQALDISLKAAQSRLDRAKAKLRQKMKREFGDHYLVPCLLLSAPLSPPISVAPPVAAAGGSVLAAGGVSAWAWKSLAVILALTLPYLAWSNFQVRPSDAEGAALFAMEMDPDVSVQEPGKAPRQEILAAAADQLAQASVNVKIPVVDAQGLPIPEAQATVWSKVFSRPNFVWLDSHEDSKRLLSQNQADENGFLSLQVEKGRSVMVLIASPFGQVTKRRFTASAGLTALDPVPLAAAGSIQGEVVDESGLPLAGVLILAQFTDKANPYSTKAYVSRSWSSADGSFEIPSLAPGEYFLQMALVGYEQTLSKPFIVTAGRNSAWQALILPVGLDLQTQVLDPENNPIAHAKIWVAHESEISAQSQARVPGPSDQQIYYFSDTQGKVRISGLRKDGRSGLVVNAPGYLKKTIAPVNPNQLPTITLQRGLSVSFQVLALQKPIGGAQVRLIRHRKETSVSYTLRSKSNGMAVFQGLTAGVYQASIVDRRGSFRLPPFEIKRSGQDFLLPLEPGAGISIVALDARSKAIAGLSIQLIYIRPLPEDSQGSVQRGEFPLILEQTDGRGRFQTRAFPGVWEIQAQARGLAPWIERVKLVEGGTLNLEHRFEATGSAAILVKDSGSTPLPRLQIVLLPTRAQAEAKRGRTDDQGAVHFDNLRPGDFWAFPWFGPAPETPPADALKMEVVSGISTALLLTTDLVSRTTFLALNQNLPQGGGYISVSRLPSEQKPDFDSRTRFKLKTKPDGTYGPISLRTGKYRIALKPGPSQPEQRFELTLSPGTETHTLEFAGAGLAGRLVDNTGRALAGVHVELERWVASQNPQSQGFILEAPRGPQGLGPVHTLSDAEGNFYFAMLPKGSWHIQVRTNGWHKPQLAPFHTDGLQETTLGDVALGPSCTLRLDLQGNALEATRMRNVNNAPVGLLHLESGYFYRLHADSQGYIERSDLPAGDYEIHLGDRQPELIRLNPDSITQRSLH
jgi:RNA polymerase sigma-70 factor, ECF subfamily